MSLVAVVFPQFKLLQKFQKNPNKYQQDGTFRNPEGGPGGPSWRPDGQVARPTPSRATRAPGSPRCPLASPIGLYYLFVPEILKENPASRNTSLFCRRY